MISIYDAFFRILLSILIGGGIGLERDIRQREAGIKTNSLVCLGSCLYTISSIIIAGKDFDPGRIAAQIVSGIGFLGIGVIVKSKGKIEGITTAAGLWVVAALGMAVGMGYYLIAILGFLGAMTILILFFKFEMYYTKKFFQKEKETKK